MASTQHSEFTGKLAAADLSAKKFHFVKLVTDDTVNLATAATDDILGVLVNKPTLNEVASVQRPTGGATFKVVLNATLARGAKITTDANGKAVAATAGQKYVGKLLSGGVANDIKEAVGEEGVA